MKIFITGISGVGKSSVAEKLFQHGIPSIDIDNIEGLCRWVNNTTHEIKAWNPGMTQEWYENHKYICDEEKLINLMNQYNGMVVVVGLPSNRHDLLHLFNKIFLLQCGEETFLKRIDERTSHDFGKNIREKENILSWYKNFEEKMLEKGAIAINTEEPLNDVVDKIIKHIKS